MARPWSSDWKAAVTISSTSRCGISTDGRPAPARGLRAARGARRASLALAVVAVVAALVGCSDPSGEPARTEPTAQADPCPDGGSRAELGVPRRGGDHAEFTTAGGTVHVAVRAFEEGGLFDPDVGLSAVYFGDVGSPPSYDEQRGRVANVVAETSVKEGSWAELDLEAGRYWIWVTNGADVVVAGCEPDSVTDPLAVTPGS